ncbi:AraC family transcriptional regulator [Polyangium spumosum]|uniref:Helix-turn-helix domain-containing protein n=1 Tax=Polyangium spumosum TaxID=889282 RepID=A0A6N7PW89_9BACT|nr:AraC family transcriptional regulator [Polyangium spumosum]MRG93071.1 helix-turn-helix domain-containing protein [Polyangium spumosum]
MGVGMARASGDLPAAYALHLVDLVARWGVSPPEVLDGLGLTRESLTNPAARISLETTGTLVKRAIALTGEPGLSLFMGLQMRLSSHGYLGFAAMTAGTIRQAIELAIRFVPTRTTALAFHLHVEGETASLVLEERAPLGEAREFILVTLMMGIAQIARDVTKKELVGDADFAFEEPGHFSRFAHLAPGRVRFGKAKNRIVFASSVLDLPLDMADPVAMQLAREQCEREMQALGRDDRTAARVRELLPLPEGYRSLEEIAQQIGVSPRTLKRRLADAGTSYSDLLDDLRRERAMLLLRDESLSREQIAERLGYSDAANFARAFRRWTGKTPGMLRKP